MIILIFGILETIGAIMMFMASGVAFRENKQTYGILITILGAGFLSFGCIYMLTGYLLLKNI